MGDNEQSKRKMIGGFIAEVVTWTEGGEKRSSCFVSHGQHHCSSLALAQDIGEIEDSGGSRAPIKVSQRTLDRIEEWALENGY